MRGFEIEGMIFLIDELTERDKDLRSFEADLLEEAAYEDRGTEIGREDD